MQLVGLAIVVLIGTAAGEDQPKADRDRLQGAWEAAWVQRAGRLNPRGFEHQLVIDGDKFRFLSPDGKAVLCEGKFELEPGETPKRINLTVTTAADRLAGWGPPVGKLPPDAVGIYEFTEDGLKLCWGPSPRPETFAGDDRPHILVRFRRPKR